LPIEVASFGVPATRLAIEKTAARLKLSGDLVLRRDAGGHPFVTDGGHNIIDAHFGRITGPEELAAALAAVPGVVEHGLFIGLASTAIIARGDCIEWLSP
jgi:ribose 5-phosphate isomerase A